MHLSDDAMKKLEANDGLTVSYFRDHLATECAECEAYLETHPVLDGAADLVLARVAPPGKDEGDFAAIWRRLRPRRWVAGASVGVCVTALVLALGAGRFAAIPSGVKGAPRVQLELQMAFQSTDGQVRRVEPGEALPALGRLLFRYHSSEAVLGRLYRQRDAEAPALVGEIPLEAGTHDLTDTRGLLGIDLTDEAGTTRFILEALPGEGEAARAEAVVQISPSPH